MRFHRGKFGDSRLLRKPVDRRRRRDSRLSGSSSKSRGNPAGQPVSETQERATAATNDGSDQSVESRKEKDRAPIHRSGLPRPATSRKRRTRPAAQPLG